MVLDSIKDVLFTLGEKFRIIGKGRLGKAIGIVGVVLVLPIVILGFIWNAEPDLFDVDTVAKDYAKQEGNQVVTGYVTTYTLKHVTETLLNKSGGFLSNDVMPPSVLMDNMPSWEFGVLVQVRDLSRAMRKSFSRSQSQSVEDKDLAIAEPQFSFDHRSFMLPSSEKEYKKGLKKLDKYLQRLADPKDQNAQFYARADNLRDWLADVETRLGSLSQRLSASVGKDRLNTDLEGEPGAKQSTYKKELLEVKTPWLEIDNVFFEARGTAWALIHFLRAIETDFADILEKKKAVISLRQIIRELEATQEVIWSPVILNGSGFGFLANHSLVMASYISRANAALIQLRSLLQKG
ncbi:DUF2333 family protein [Zooshikella marina]|uniref:DUF2333 family protein n=1 Tax=Zooshikella ganghwensis TaxID=202772 RepID=UPI001BAFCD73|nr:DUF2333 family protein [Zooshikella ganghwensis]MBU2706168.1 DUF2333 family protein [Zooshikella ganghwensis]